MLPGDRKKSGTTEVLTLTHWENEGAFNKKGGSA